MIFYRNNMAAEICLPEKIFSSWLVVIGYMDFHYSWLDILFNWGLLDMYLPSNALLINGQLILNQFINQKFPENIAKKLLRKFLFIGYVQTRCVAILSLSKIQCEFTHA